MNNDKLMSLYNRTLNNCKYYEKQKDTFSLISEIGCLRGIAYCIEESGTDPLSLPDLMHFIKISNGLLNKTTAWV